MQYNLHYINDVVHHHQIRALVHAETGGDCCWFEAAPGVWAVQQPPSGHRIKARGGRGVAMGPAEEIQPPFASSSWFVRIQRQFLLLAVTSLTCRPIKTKRFRRNITYAISDVPTKAIGLINLRRCRCCCQWFDMGVFLFGESVGIVMVVSTTSGWSTSLFGWRSDHGGFSGLVTEIPPPLDWTPYHCVTMMWREKDATKYGWFDCRLTCTLCALLKITTTDIA